MCASRILQPENPEDNFTFISNLYNVYKGLCFQTLIVYLDRDIQVFQGNGRCFETTGTLKRIEERISVLVGKKGLLLLPVLASSDQRKK